MYYSNENEEQPPISVVNMSLGGPRFTHECILMLTKLEDTGVVVCILQEIKIMILPRSPMVQIHV